MTSFTPAFGLKNRHFQTLYPAFFRKITQPKTTTEIFELDDGDFVECTWSDKPLHNDRDIVVLFHGLEGSYKSPYISGHVVFVGGSVLKPHYWLEEWIVNFLVLFKKMIYIKKFIKSKKKKQTL